MANKATNQHTKVIVFYDSPCIDGACSAWAYNESLSDQERASVAYIPIKHDLFRNEPIIEACKSLPDGAQVVFLDTRPDDKMLDMLLGINNDAALPKISSVTVVDHHSSELEPLQQYSLDHGQQLAQMGTELNLILDAETPSAALLAWEYFNKGKSAPSLFNFVGKMEKGDIESDGEFAIAALIDGENLDTPVDAFRAVDYLVALKEDEMIAQGNGLIAGQFSQIKKALKDQINYAYLEVLPGVKSWVPMVNMNPLQYNRRVDSAVLEAAEGYDVVGMWSVQGDTGVKLSLRSNGEPPVDEIAKHLVETIARTGGGRPTQAAVHFESMEQFSSHVRLYSKAEMTKAKWRPPKILTSSSQAQSDTQPVVGTHTADIVRPNTGGEIPGDGVPGGSH